MKQQFAFLRFLNARLLPSVLIAIVVYQLWVFSQNIFERMLYDAWSRETAQSVEDTPNSQAAASHVVLLLLDDESVIRLRQKFGPFPWKRKVWLDIFQRIQAKNPSVLVFDGLFTGLDPEEDSPIFDQMKAMPNLVTGMALSFGEGLNTRVPNFYHLNLGVVNTEKDVDGSIRSIAPTYSFSSQQQSALSGVFPSLSVAAAYQYLSIQNPSESWAYRIDKNSATNANVLVLFSEDNPKFFRKAILTPDNRFMLRWYQLLPTKERTDRSHFALPLWYFYPETAKTALERANAKIALSKVKDKIALIGASADMFKDYSPSPMSPNHLGVDIHATAIDNLLNESIPFRTTAYTNWLLLILYLISAIIVRIQIKTLGPAILYAVMIAVIHYLMAFLLFKSSGLIVDVITPELAIVLGFVLGSLIRDLTQDKQVKTLEKNLSQLVSQSVYQEMQRHGFQLTPGGQRQEITSVFVDIRNFTAMAENLSPNLLTEILNEFYTEIEEIVFQHKGTLDKFMGDGVLIMFGAPIPSVSHADQALKACREMYTVTAELSRRWKDKHRLDVEVGITLNSGVAFVGFLGPSHKLEYTAVGDTVNLCVRLQDVTKQFKTRLVFSEYTVALLSENRKSIVSLGSTTVRGRESAIGVYTFQDTQNSLGPVELPLI